MINIAIIVQARMGSTRLPGKVLREIDGKPLLGYLFERIKKVKHTNNIILATTDAPQDKKLLEFAKKIGIKSFAGSEEDVLDRYYQAGKKFKVDVIVRVTGDCPLLDPQIIDQCLDVFLNKNCDYLSNVNPPTYPDGLDTEVFKMKTLERAWNDAKLESEREHVTPFIFHHPEQFSLINIRNDEDWSNYRLTVDEPEDFELISRIVKYFKDRWTIFTTRDVIALLQGNQEFLSINSKFKRNEGYAKSLQGDSLSINPKNKFNQQS